ncbi:hypothetical protein [Flavobacterium panici]|uniref:Uncharacterized protein n=1 Tax=Flavobacterium panici TaxID=2654843 RepID=A0A9N8J5E7_9FLAO|nr:hypothetical protein [Flavobacterium panici]CAC9975552.1 hypothetical protein FLAPXU55_03266 [Flavobacterium panici]
MDFLEIISVRYLLEVLGAFTRHLCVHERDPRTSRGNIGFNGTLGIPKIGYGLSYDMYDNFEGNTDVFSGMRDYSMGYTGSLLFGGTYTKSAESDFKGF